jgi:MYXO-CTERM domain-containing protein
MKKTVLTMLLALAAVVYSAKAVNVELMLLIDGSGSINGTEFTQQQTGYQNALTTLLPTDSTVTIGVWQFGSLPNNYNNPVIQTVFAPTVIDATSKASLLSALSLMTQIGGNTPIGAAINTAVAALTGLGHLNNAGFKQLIDVSTDGVNTIGPAPAPAATAAIAAGVEQVNGLFVGTGTTDTSWVPAGSLKFYAPSGFSAFETAITEKLRQEIQGTPDAGSSLALLLVGLVGLGAIRRRSA